MRLYRLLSYFFSGIRKISNTTSFSNLLDNRKMHLCASSRISMTEMCILIFLCSWQSLSLAYSILVLSFQLITDESILIWILSVQLVPHYVAYSPAPLVVCSVLNPNPMPSILVIYIKSLLNTRSSHESRNSMKQLNLPHTLIVLSSLLMVM